MAEQRVPVDVKPMPGLEQLPFAEVWFRAVDDAAWRRASAAARALGKSGLEVWTTTDTPGVVEFLEPRGYAEVRRYVIAELHVASAAEEAAAPGLQIVTFAERPDLAPELFQIALEAYPDQPGRSEQVIESLESWRRWGLDGHPPDSYFIALDGPAVLGYGILDVDGDAGHHAFTGIARAARGRGVASAIKRAQIAWAKQNGLRTLRTANETQLEGMLALNRRHGYRSLYDEIVLRGPAATVESAA
ncbi:MAG: GNAT family N-acetyltransferase [Gaiellaceae bacterium]